VSQWSPDTNHIPRSLDEIALHPDAPCSWLKMYWSESDKCWVLHISKLDVAFEVEQVSDYFDSVQVKLKANKCEQS